MVAKKVNSYEQWTALVDEAQEFIECAKNQRELADGVEYGGDSYQEFRDMEDRCLQWSMAASLLALNYRA